MLQSIDAEDIKCTVFRIATWEPIQLFVKNQGEKPEHMKQLIKILEDLPDHFNLDQPEKLEEIPIKELEKALLDSVFTPNEELKNEHSGRFSDGAFPVFYSALNKTTAKAEVRYQHKKRFMSDSKSRREVNRMLFSCTFSGSVKDLQSVICPKLTQDEDVDDGYQFCQQLGREAKREGLYGLLAPSARSKGGTNLPVFLRRAISHPQPQYRITTVYNPKTKSVNARIYAL